MKEDLLQFIWKMKLLPLKLKTTNNSVVLVKDFGTLNHDQGPDFLNSKVFIDKLEFAGSVEIHINGSDWNKHNHSNSPLYDNVILHVVYKSDIEICNTEDQPIPTIELKNIISPHFLWRYKNVMDSQKEISCESSINRTENIDWMIVKDRLLANRLEQKYSEIKSILKFNKYDWEESFYQLLFKCVGMGVNAEAFLQLAKQVKLKEIKKLGNNVFAIESIFFGQMNLLSSQPNPYALELAREYDYQKQKLCLKKNYNQVKFSRMRPANFPTIRLAQLSILISSCPTLFRKLIEANSIKEIEHILYEPLSGFWSHHFTFNSISKKIIGGFGKIMIHSLILNLIVPFLYSYGKYYDNDAYLEKALLLIQKTNKENNRITRIWSKLNVENKNGYDSQALVELYKNHCTSKKCLNCAIFSKIIITEND